MGPWLLPLAEHVHKFLDVRTLLCDRLALPTDLVALRFEQILHAAALILEEFNVVCNVLEALF